MQDKIFADRQFGRYEIGESNDPDGSGASRDVERVAGNVPCLA